MKSVHRALHLRHHKHTGKLLPHKHTSYRVLFLLMLAPIIMMALVGQLATAVDYQVTAVVPAVMPDGAPVITSPKDNSSINSGQVQITGTCPTSQPLVIIAIYDNDVLAGSGQCMADGTFSVSITLYVGNNTIVAIMHTMTGQIGAKSTIININRVSSIHQSFGIPLRIIGSDVFLQISADGGVVWRGQVVGGVAPYALKIDWGDGTTDSYEITDQAEQMFPHTYKDRQFYKVIISVVDANGDAQSIQTTAGSLAEPILSVGSNNREIDFGALPFAMFVQLHIWQIYIGTFFALVFLWYLERGRHLPGLFLAVIRKRFMKPRQHHR
ncbi:MAG: hypothetical protein WAW80_02655 [Candidatus Saccharimonadales bacterium]